MYHVIDIIFVALRRLNWRDLYDNVCHYSNNTEQDILYERCPKSQATSSLPRIGFDRLMTHFAVQLLFGWGSMFHRVGSNDKFAARVSIIVVRACSSGAAFDLQMPLLLKQLTYPATLTNIGCCIWIHWLPILVVTLGIPFKISTRRPPHHYINGIWCISSSGCRPSSVQSVTFTRLSKWWQFEMKEVF